MKEDIQEKERQVRKKEEKQIPLSKINSSEEKRKSKKEKITVKKLDSSITAKIKVHGTLPFDVEDNVMNMATDTGVNKTIMNYKDFEKIKKSCGIVKTSKKFRPYGTPVSLNILGKAKVTMKAEAGAEISTWIYIHKSNTEKSLLGERDARRLGIVTLNLKGSTEEIELDDEESVKCIAYTRKEDPPTTGIVSGGETQEEIDQNMEKLRQRHPKAFNDRTGKYTGEPIKIHYPEKYAPHIQPNRRIPLHYVDVAYKELQKLLDEDVYEGPLETEEPGTFINNLVITDKKNSDGVRITIDCREVNKILYATHETIPTVEELRHELLGSDRFSVLDLTNCFSQFEIEESARKLFAFRTRWGIFRPKRLVQGASPSSSEAQKKVREILQGLPNVFNIKDDVIVHGKGKAHDEALEKVVQRFEDNGLTMRPRKCYMGKTHVKWFGFIFNKDGMSPDPEKCRVIREWPAPTNLDEVRSFLQTVQFNSKFLGSEEPGALSYQDLTAPLRCMTKKNARFNWGETEAKCFEELKKRLISD